MAGTPAMFGGALARIANARFARYDPIAKLDPIDDVLSDDDSPERCEIAFVVWLRRVVERVARTSRIQSRARPGEIAAREAMAIHFVALHRGIANRRLLIDEVRNDARELRTHDRSRARDALERIHRQRCITCVELDLDGTARRFPARARERSPEIGRHDPTLDDASILCH